MLRLCNWTRYWLSLIYESHLLAKTASLVLQAVGYMFPELAHCSHLIYA